MKIQILLSNSRSRDCLLKQCYENHIELLIGSYESDINAKKHTEIILHKEKMENNPVAKASQFNYNSYF
jgi:hypothetical protein